MPVRMELKTHKSAYAAAAATTADANSVVYTV